MLRFRVLDCFCDVSESVLAGVSELTVSPDCDCVVPVFSIIESTGVADHFSPCEARYQRYNFLCEQVNRARMNFEMSLVKAVPAIKRRPTPVCPPCKTPPEGMRSRTPPPPEGTFARQADMARSTTRRGTRGEGGTGSGRRDI